MKNVEVKIRRRLRRKSGLRKLIVGSCERPRLSVFRSLNNIYAQIIDDSTGVTLCAASTRDKELRDKVKTAGNKDGAKIVGTLLAERAKGKNIAAVCFDRNGFKYHGRLKALADAAREAGLKF